MQLNKKSILISWPAHCFVENIIPIIDNIYKEYEITIITIDYALENHVNLVFKKLKNSKKICDFYIVPSNNKIYYQFKYLNKNKKKLQKKNFDIWLSMTEHEYYQKFVKNIILRKSCKIIILHTQITYLFVHDHFAKKLLNKKTISEKNNLSDLIKKNNLFRKLIKNKNKLFNIFYILKILINYLNQRNRKIIKYIRFIFIHFYSQILYLFFFKKKLIFDRFDNLTLMSSGKVDLLLFTDELEVEAHKKLFNKKNIKLVRHTGHNNCKCGTKFQKKNNILLLLSVFVGLDNIKKEYLQLFYDGLKIIYNKTKFNRVDLRKHPRDKGKWQYKLCKYLNENGIKARIVDSNISVSETVCNYIGVVGPASSALRDAAHSCRNIFVIGFEELSLFRYNDPKFMYGNSNGIGWINYDGSYNKNIFNLNKHFHLNYNKKILSCEEYIKGLNINSIKKV